MCNSRQYNPLLVACIHVHRAVPLHCCVNRPSRNASGCCIQHVCPPANVSTSCSFNININVRHLIIQRRVKYYNSLYLSSNSLLYNNFLLHLMLYSDSDTLMETVFDNMVMQCRSLLNQSIKFICDTNTQKP